MSKTINIIGQRFGRLVVISQAESKNRQAMFNCLCDCENTKAISGHSLRIGKTKSCGCLYKEVRSDIARMTIAKAKHGASYDRLYFVWNDMKSRCGNPNDISYSNYGGRGIRVCNEWQNFIPFQEWAYANGYNPNAKRGECTLDRIDVNKGYSPQNCRWVNMEFQSNNRRNTPMLTLNGETHSLTEWAKIKGVNRSVLYRKYINNKSVEDILNV